MQVFFFSPKCDLCDGYGPFLKCDGLGTLDGSIDFSLNALALSQDAKTADSFGKII